VKESADVPEWMQLILALLGSAPFVTGIGWWFKTRRDDRIADKLADVTEIKDLRQKIFDMQQERIKTEITRRETADQTMRILSDLRGELIRVKLLKNGNGNPP
jgi:hypothetical protein